VGNGINRLRSIVAFMSSRINKQFKLIIPLVILGIIFKIW